MNKTDKISKDAKLLVESAKDVLTNNLISAIKSRTVIVEESQIPKLLQIVDMSMNDGYQRSLRTFQKSIASLLEG
jgi:hypothetical protein